jgi:propanol-preferring alcohol dehydrogenase
LTQDAFAAAGAMTAMQLDGVGAPLRAVTRPLPQPGEGEIRIRVAACGVCRTDLHIVDGEVMACWPIVPGHEIVGTVEALGAGVSSFEIGDRVGVPWLAHSCGVCAYCRSGAENLCDEPAFTGCTRDGGYATHTVADARYCFPIPAMFADAEAAPLLCAGLIGWRALRAAGEGKRIGLYGFGAAAHIIAQIAAWQKRDVYAFTRPGDTAGQEFARSLGCVWAGSSEAPPPAQLDAAIIFAPVGALVPAALRAVRKGGRVICAGIHMSDIPQFPYADLWGERSIQSIANLTRDDGETFFEVAAQAAVRTAITCYPLDEAAAALDDLRNGRLAGAAVLIPPGQSLPG